MALAFTCALAAQSTTVDARRPSSIDDDRVPLDSSTNSAALGADPEDALLAAAGASLVHDGGPLAPARPMVRGLGGARLGVDVGGLDLSDPATGLVDAAFLPWSAADVLDVATGAQLGGASSAAGASSSTSAGDDLAGRVHLGLYRGPGVRARFLFGSLDTTRASLAAANPSGLVAVDAGITNGDFTYLPSSATAPTSKSALVRTDNDQERGSILALGHTRTGDVVVDALAFGGVHGGGIAGFAGAPALHLRGDDALAGVHVDATSAVGNAQLVGAVDARAAHRATWSSTLDASGGDAGGLGAAVFGNALPSAAGNDHIESSSIAGSLALRRAAIGGPGDGTHTNIDVEAGLDRSGLVDGRFTRTGVSASAIAQSRLGFLRTRVDVDGRAVSDAGFLWGAGARAEVGDVVRASLGITRASRAPTLDELYAPRGLVLGNPRLKPEAVDDVEAALAFVPGRVVDARIVGFAGLLEDGIAYVNKNAFSIEPVNLGSARRAGIDTSITVEPSTWLRIDAAAEALASFVDATRAPLPLAAPFSARVAVRAGSDDGTQLSAVLRARGPAPSNSFGTLKSSPYHLVDLVARTPIATGLVLGAAIENVFDVEDARDANQLPLPGRLVFVTLEVHS